MKRFLPLIGFLVLTGGAAWYGNTHHVPAKNPDPNHTHADFAVWINGKQVDFSDPNDMTSEQKEAKLPPNDPRRYLHLHDGNGHVIHRHKPGLALCDFISSLNLSGEFEFSVYVNGVLMPRDKECSYVFKDGDHLLVTNSMYDQAEVNRELKLMTDDACLYSQTCPWRGKVPVENCVSDPTVPCTE